MIKSTILIIGLIIATIGILMIYDAKIIAKKIFSFGDQNDGPTSLKIFGFFITIIGLLIIYFCMNKLF